MIRHLLLGLAALTASTASAGVIGLATTVTNFTPPDAALIDTGHQGYVLSVITDDGSLIRAVNVGISGKLHQRWSALDLDNFEFTPSPVGTSVTNGDSHLNPITGAIITIPANENNVSPSVLADTATRDYGYGTFLRGAWEIPEASQTNQATIGYIVVPNSDLSNLRVGVQVVTSNGTFTPSRFDRIPTLTSSPVVGPSVELQFPDAIGIGPNPVPLPISLTNTGSGVINVNSITLAGPHASLFTLTGTLPTTLTGFAAAQQFGVKPIVPLPGGTGDLMAVVQVRTDWGNLDFDVLLKVPEPSTLLIAACAALPLARRIRLFTPARKAYR